MEPDLRIEFTTLPSWNNFLGHKNPQIARNLLSKWRKIGFDQALFHAGRKGAAISEWTEYGVSEKGKQTSTIHRKIEPLFFNEPVHLNLVYWRPDNRNYDTFSPCVKPVVDGFVDAGLIADDNHFNIESFSTIFAGVDKSLGLSKEVQRQRTIDRKVGGKKFLTPARYYFDFYLSSRITKASFPFS